MKDIEVLANPEKALKNALRKLKTIVDAQSKTANTEFFDAAINYRTIRNFIDSLKLLSNTKIKAYNDGYWMLMDGYKNETKIFN